MEKLRSNKWVLVLVWVIVGLILLQFLDIIFEIICYARMSSNTEVTETVPFTTFLKNKGDFEAVAELATELFDEEYENSDKLINLSLRADGTCFYHYTDPSLNKDKIIDYSDKVKEAFDTLGEIYHYGGNVEGGLPRVTADENQVVFSGTSYQSAVVYNHSISKPKTLRNFKYNEDETEVFALRLGLKWFQCGARD